MKKLIITLVICLFKCQCFAQALQVGDELPPIVLQNVVNHSTNEIVLTDYKDKILLLDFSATWCGASVGILPKLSGLQKKYAADLQIIGISTEAENKVSNFCNRIKTAEDINIPYATKAISIRKYFPYVYMPHIVWVGKNKKIIAITGGKEVTEENIQAAIEGKLTALPVKKDSYKKRDDQQSLFIHATPIITSKGTQMETVNNSEVLFSSVITTYREGLSAIAKYRDTAVTIVNMPVLNMYQAALGKADYRLMLKNRVFIECSNPEKIQKAETDTNDYAEWAKLNTYCYQLLLPKSLKEKRFEIMTKELNHYFGNTLNIEGRIEKRKLTCYVLKKTSNKTDQLVSKSTQWQREENAYYFKIEKLPLDELLLSLSFFYQQHSPYPILNETNLKEPVDIELNAKLSDMNAVNAALEKYGLKFFKEKRNIDVIVIGDK